MILAMSHHPLHLLNEFDRRRAQERIERACHFFHCGHLHEPEARVAGAAGPGCLILAVGASFETRQFHNTYSCVTLDLLSAVRSVTTVQYNPATGSFAAAPPTHYAAEVAAVEQCGVRELAEAIVAYRPALQWAGYLAALLLGQKTELPIPTQTNYTFGSFGVMEGLPDSDLKCKTVAFMNFRNVLRVLYKHGALSELFARHGDVVAQYGAALQELCEADPALKDRLAAQESDSRKLAGAEPLQPFSHAESLLVDLASAREWDLLREQALRQINS